MATHNHTYGGRNNKFFTGNSAISFRALKDSFQGPSGEVKLSTYKRDTSVTSNPVVPDSIDNLNVNTSESNLSLEDYRNTIKEREVLLTSNETSFYDIDNVWSGTNSGVNLSGELTRNIVKKHIIKGDIKSPDMSQAAGFSANAQNYEIHVAAGKGIYGRGGDGGDSEGEDGENGGGALYVNGGSSYSAIPVRIWGEVYGGGGGGGAGNNGNNDTKNCYTTTNRSERVYDNNTRGRRRRHNRRRRWWGGRNDHRHTRNRNGDGCTSKNRASCRCPNTTDARTNTPENSRSGRTHAPSRSGNGTLTREECRGSRKKSRGCYSSWYRECDYKHNYTLTSYGGNYGTGGDGKGHQQNQRSGNSGNSAETINCHQGGSARGNSGNSGGSGGSWGQAGGSASRSGGRGGNKGHAISGNRYNTHIISGGRVK